MKFKLLNRSYVVGLLAFSFLAGQAGAASADSTRDAQWPIESFVVNELWETSKGEGVTVGVVDTGFRSTHQDLHKNMLDLKQFGKRNENGKPPVEPGADYRDHGTAMASIIAGHGRGESGITGLAPEANILPIATQSTEKEISGAIRYAVENDAKVISISLGLKDSSALHDAVNYAISKDVVIVASVGNDGISKEEYPAAYPGVIGVGAVGPDGVVWEDSQRNSSVDLIAPGVDIVGAGGKSDDAYLETSGTSASTAYVSAAAALIRAEHPDLTAGQVANRLVKTAGLPDEMQGKDLPDERYGYGFIRPRAALTDDIPAGPEEGPLPMPKAGEESGLQPSTGDGPTPSLLEEWGPLVGGVTVGALVVVGGVLWLVSRSQRRSRTPVTVPGQTGLPNYPGQQGTPPYPASAPGPQPPPHQPPAAPGQYHPGNPGPGGPGSGHGQGPYSG